MGFDHAYLDNIYLKKFKENSRAEKTIKRGGGIKEIYSLKINLKNRLITIIKKPLSREVFWNNMVNEKKNIGNWGENLAKEYLIRHGYKIIAANYRTGRLEIDLITRHNRQLIFIEVKTRLQTTAGAADNPLTAKQIKNLKQAIIAYCLKNRASLDAVRLDLIIVSVDRRQKCARLKHYRDIF